MTRPQDRRDFLRITLGSLGFWTLAGCGGGGAATTPAAAPVPPPANNITSEGTPMFQVPASVLAGIVARPETFLRAYRTLGGSTPSSTYVQSQLGAPFASLSDSGCMATFASLVAFDAAPSGSTALDPMNSTMQQLLTAQALACGHFCKLATLLALLGDPQLIPPDTDAGSSPPKASLHFLVWLDNVPLNTGFHSQLIISNALDNAYLLLDPTFAYALRIPYVGAGPQAGLTVIENAATMLQTPIAQANLAVLDPRGTAAVPQMLSTQISGALGPQYIYHDSIYGSEGWDARIEQIFDNMG